MNLSRDVLRTSYALCRRKARRAGSNFYLSFLFLPAQKRRAMDALYAFMRHTDDLADSPHPDLPAAEALTRWRAALDHALVGHFDPPPVGAAAAGAVEEAAGRALLPAVVDTVRRFHVPPEHLRAVIEGVEMDVRRTEYETFDELREYCRCVASAVGLACIHIWGFSGPEALGPAEDCGIALQLTNILRDVREDAEAERVYLPQEDLRACGLGPDDLLRGVADARFDRLMDLEIDRAEGFYQRGSRLIDYLEPGGRRVFGVIMATYHSLLAKIRRRPGDVLSRRVGLTRGKKLRIVARWALLPPKAAALA